MRWLKTIWKWLNVPSSDEFSAEMNKRVWVITRTADGYIAYDKVGRLMWMASGLPQESYGGTD